jgi:hypothetical protein
MAYGLKDGMSFHEEFLKIGRFQLECTNLLGINSNCKKIQHIAEWSVAEFKLAMS